MFLQLLLEYLKKGSKAKKNLGIVKVRLCFFLDHRSKKCHFHAQKKISIQFFGEMCTFFRCLLLDGKIAINFASAVPHIQPFRVRVEPSIFRAYPFSF